MAFSFGSENETLKVICSKDEAVRCDDEKYQQYLETLDEELLDLDPEFEPTRFVLKKTLPYALSKDIKNQQMGYRDGDIEIRLGWWLDYVRAVLIDIENPGAGLEFKKDGDKLASKNLVEKLDGYGIVNELYKAHQTFGKRRPSVDKKNSQPSLS